MVSLSENHIYSNNSSKIILAFYLDYVTMTHSLIIITKVGSQSESTLLYV